MMRNFKISFFSLLLSLMVTMVHGFIPHHHHDPAEIAHHHHGTAHHHDATAHDHDSTDHDHSLFSHAEHAEFTLSSVSRIPVPDLGLTLLDLFDLFINDESTCFVNQGDFISSKSPPLKTILPLNNFSSTGLRAPPFFQAG